MRWFSWFIALLVCASALGQTSRVKARKPRFFKCERGVAADYLRLAPDGSCRIIAREHMGVSEVENGRWQQKGSTITFNPLSHLRGGKMVIVAGKWYDATQVKYKSNTFLTFKSEDAAEPAISVEEIKQELDSDPTKPSRTRIL